MKQDGNCIKLEQPVTSVAEARPSDTYLNKKKCNSSVFNRIKDAEK